MKALCKRWIARPVVILILGVLPAIGNLAQAITPCDIATEQASYTTGQTVRLSQFRLTNPSVVAQAFEWKLWLKSPALPPQVLVNFGFDGSLVLPGSFDVDFAALVGPVTLFTIDEVLFPSGSYEIGCRLLDPVTGEEHPDADVIVFVVP